MKSIPLTQGKIALIDDEDFEKINKYKWCAKDQGGGRFYAIRRTGLGIAKHIRMHRFIIDAPDGMEVDHIDGNRLNNQKANLRVCTHAENMLNLAKRSDNKSGVKGVCWDTSRKKWIA